MHPVPGGVWPHSPVGPCSGMEKDDDFTQTPGVLAAEWLGTNVQREQQQQQQQSKYESKSVSASSKADPALSTNIRRVLAWACSCGSREGDTSLFPAAQPYKPPSALLCKATAPMGAVSCPPHLHPTRDNWYQQPHTPPGSLTMVGTSICQCLSPQVAVVW